MGTSDASNSKFLRRQLADLRSEHDALRERFDTLTDRFLNLSQEVAETDFGRDRISAALDALHVADHRVQSWVVQQPHPYGALIAWHRTAMN